MAFLLTSRLALRPKPAPRHLGCVPPPLSVPLASGCYVELADTAGSVNVEATVTATVNATSVLAAMQRLAGMSVSEVSELQRAVEKNRVHMDMIS